MVPIDDLIEDHVFALQKGEALNPGFSAKTNPAKNAKSLSFHLEPLTKGQILKKAAASRLAHFSCIAIYIVTSQDRASFIDLRA